MKRCITALYGPYYEIFLDICWSTDKLVFTWKRAWLIINVCHSLL